jgi:hypothetical protein
MNPRANETGRASRSPARCISSPASVAAGACVRASPPCCWSSNPPPIPQLVLRPIACAEHAKRQPVTLLWE